MTHRPRRSPRPGLPALPDQHPGAVDCELYADDLAELHDSLDAEALAQQLVRASRPANDRRRSAA